MTKRYDKTGIKLQWTAPWDMGHRCLCVPQARQNPLIFATINGNIPTRQLNAFQRVILAPSEP